MLLPIVMYIEREESVRSLIRRGSFERIRNIWNQASLGVAMIALVLMSQNAVFGNTITASSASASDVQTAINFANDGDTVIVPPGNVTWSTAVTINGKAITLQGSGTASTIINNGIAGGSDLVINPPTNGKWLTVSGFRFNAHPTAGASGSTGMIHISGDGYWRLCSNYVEIGYTGVVQYGNGGLIDHNFFNADFGNGGNPTGFYHLGNNNIWLTTIKYGTVTNWTYVEHNVFTWDSGWSGANGADDGGEGNATCFRYNIVTNTWTGCHGADSSGKTASSTFGGEYYSNTFFNGIGGNIDTAMSARGGTGLFWGNTLRGLANNNYNQIVKLRYYRWSVPGGYSDWPSFPASIDGWLISSGTYAGWPAYMQQGYTGPIQGVDVNTGNNIGGATTCTEVSSPIYVWGNQTIGVSASTVVAADSLIFLNTNYFLSGPPSGYTPLAYPYPLGGSAQSTTNPPQITAAARQRFGCGRADRDVQRHRVRLWHFDLSMVLVWNQYSRGHFKLMDYPADGARELQQCGLCEYRQCLWQCDFVERLPLRDRWRRPVRLRLARPAKRTQSAVRQHLPLRPVGQRLWLTSGVSTRRPSPARPTAATP